MTTPLDKIPVYFLRKYSFITSFSNISNFPRVFDASRLTWYTATNIHTIACINIANIFFATRVKLLISRLIIRLWYRIKYSRVVVIATFHFAMRNCQTRRKCASIYLIRIAYRFNTRICFDYVAFVYRGSKQTRLFDHSQMPFDDCLSVSNRVTKLCRFLVNKSTLLYQCNVYSTGVTFDIDFVYRWYTVRCQYPS